MKSFIICILFLVIWILIGHFSPLICLILTFVVYPILFILTYRIKYRVSRFVFIPFCFVIIYLNDYFFRIFGGGIHDDAGRGWCEITFYLTLLTTTVSSLFIMIYYTEYVKNKGHIEQKIKDIGFVILLFSITLFIFMKTSINI
jgi:hypothetical protein